MPQKVVQTVLNAEEHSALVKLAKKKGLTVKQALREAALRWTKEESGIDPERSDF